MSEDDSFFSESTEEEDIELLIFNTLDEIPSYFTIPQEIIVLIASSTSSPLALCMLRCTCKTTRDIIPVASSPDALLVEAIEQDLPECYMIVSGGKLVKRLCGIFALSKYSADIIVQKPVDSIAKWLSAGIQLTPRAYDIIILWKCSYDVPRCIMLIDTGIKPSDDTITGFIRDMQFTLLRRLEDVVDIADDRLSKNLHESYNLSRKGWETTEYCEDVDFVIKYWSLIHIKSRYRLSPDLFTPEVVVWHALIGRRTDVIDWAIAKGIIHRRDIYGLAIEHDLPAIARIATAMGIAPDALDHARATESGSPRIAEYIGSLLV